MINVCIGSSERYKQVEHYLINSIRANTRYLVNIEVLRPGLFGLEERGCTGFSLIRWLAPQLLSNKTGRYLVYLDVDMLVRGDIGQLATQYARPGQWVCLEDGSTEVMVIDQMAPAGLTINQYRDNNYLGRLPDTPLQPLIPAEWNYEADISPGNWRDAKLVHFTDLKNQPYFNDYDNEELLTELKRYDYSEDNDAG